MGIPTIDVDSELGELGRTDTAPRCECEHSAAAGAARCPHPAHVRVTLLCTEPGCDNAAHVRLLCPTCLAVWRRRWPQLRLRVRSL